MMVIWIDPAVSDLDGIHAYIARDAESIVPTKPKSKI